MHDVFSKAQEGFSKKQRKTITQFLEKLETVSPNPNVKRENTNVPIEVKDIGAMDWGAPSPTILADEHKVAIVYYLDNENPDWDGTTCHLRSPKTDEQTLAIVLMDGVRSFSQTTNDQNHGANGLGPEFSHSVWQITNSTSTICKTSSDYAAEYKHFVFGFHDTTLECLCSNFSYKQINSTAYEAIDDLREFIFKE